MFCCLPTSVTGAEHGKAAFARRKLRALSQSVCSTAQLLLFHLERKQNCKGGRALCSGFPRLGLVGEQPAAKYPVKQLLHCHVLYPPEITKSYCKNVFLSFRHQFSVWVCSRPTVLPFFSETVPNCLEFVIFFFPSARFLPG